MGGAQGIRASRGRQGIRDSIRRHYARSLNADAPYSGSGSTQHGATDQFLEAVDFFHDKVREPLER